MYAQESERVCDYSIIQCRVDAEVLLKVTGIVRVVIISRNGARLWRFYRTLKVRLHDTNRLLNRFNIWLDNRLYPVYKHPTRCQTGCTTSLTAGWLFVYAVQPVVQPVVKLVWQPVRVYGFNTGVLRAWPIE